MGYPLVSRREAKRIEIKSGGGLWPHLGSFTVKGKSEQQKLKKNEKL